MTAIFLKLLEMSALGSIVILITMFFRFLLRKSSKSLIMILWLTVAIRLLVPISIESSLSIFNLLPTINTATLITETESQHEIPATTTEAAVAKPENITSSPSTPSANVSHSQKTTPNIIAILAHIWAVGAAGIILYCLIRYTMLTISLKDATKIDRNVYLSEKVTSPFVFGFIIPRIYLPDVLSDVEKDYILLHENTHIKHGDWISKLVAMLVVSLHWFNPLVWLGYFLFEQDIEMRCDESTIKNMDKARIEEYSISIVSYSKISHNARYLVTPLGFSKTIFSKKEIKSRIKNILNYRRISKATAMTVAICLLSVSVVCTLNQKIKNTGLLQQIQNAPLSKNGLFELSALDSAHRTDYTFLEISQKNDSVETENLDIPDTDESDVIDTTEPTDLESVDMDNSVESTDTENIDSTEPTETEVEEVNETEEIDEPESSVDDSIETQSEIYTTTTNYVTDHSYTIDEYNSDNLLVKTSGYVDGVLSFTVLYEYDSNFNCIKMSSSSSDNTVAEHHLYQYDSNNNLIEDCWYFTNTNMLISRSVYEYSEYGYCISCSVYNGEGELTDSYVYD
ncbi:MAG: M56 family metallopeptidase [Clostridia bacterium]|nr:M56 family metallopeptidase [Clostridia bacterium]